MLCEDVGGGGWAGLGGARLGDGDWVGLGLARIWRL